MASWTALSSITDPIPTLIFRSLTVALTAAVLLSVGVATSGEAMGGQAETRTGAKARNAAMVTFALPPLKFRLDRGSVTPKQTVPVSVKPVKIAYRFKATRATPVSIRILKVKKNGKPGRTLKRYTPGLQRPGRWHAVRWAGRLASGRLAGSGRYKVMVGPVGGPLRGLGHLRLHGHTFPVAAPHGTRGAIGEFGAPRVDGRTHEGYDITGDCGSPLVAVRSGRILRTGYDPELYGNYIVLKGSQENRSYKYSHLSKPPAAAEGQKVKAGRRLGSIGQTGNAAGTPCHLHFEIRNRGRLLDPGPIVNSWG